MSYWSNYAKTNPVLPYNVAQKNTFTKMKGKVSISEYLQVSKINVKKEQNKNSNRRKVTFGNKKLKIKRNPSVSVGLELDFEEVLKEKKQLQKNKIKGWKSGNSRSHKSILLLEAKIEIRDRIKEEYTLGELNRDLMKSPFRDNILFPIYKEKYGWSKSTFWKIYSDCWHSAKRDYLKELAKK